MITVRKDHFNLLKVGVLVREYYTAPLYQWIRTCVRCKIHVHLHPTTFFRSESAYSCTKAYRKLSVSEFQWRGASSAIFTPTEHPWEASSL